MIIIKKKKNPTVNQVTMIMMIIEIDNGIHSDDEDGNDITNNNDNSNLYHNYHCY